MAINPYAPASATGNGTQVDFTFTFPYIAQSHIKAFLNGVATTAFTFFGSNILRFTTAPAAGVNVRITRETPAETLSTVIQPGGPIPTAGLNNNFFQSLYYNQETQYDAANQSTAGLQAQIDGITITSNNAITAASAAVTTANAADATATAASSFTQAGSGAVTRSVTSKLRDTVSVDDFGAVGDGVADDTVAIQSAIDYVGSVGGGTVFFPPGTYRNAGVEILVNGVELVGSGYGTNIIFTSPSGVAAAFCFGQPKAGFGTLTPVTRCAVRNMRIDGNRSGGAVGSAVRSTVFDGFTLENVHIKNCANNYGFAIVGTGSLPRNDLLVHNCSAFACGADGLDIKAGLERVIVDGFLSGGHLNETAGDSVGIDLRGQYISAQNIYAYDCLEIGIRVRINAGEVIAADWNDTQKAMVSLANCFAWDCRDGFALEVQNGAAITVTNLNARDCTRYGIVTSNAGTPGSVVINGATTKDCYVGLVHLNGDLSLTVSGLNVYGGLDGMRILAGNVAIHGGRILQTTRYGIDLRSFAAGQITLTGMSIDGCLTGVLADATTTGGRLDVIGCTIKNSTSRGVQLLSSAIKARFIGGATSGNATNIHSLSSDTKFRDMDGVATFGSYTFSIPIDSTGAKDNVVTHGLAFTPLPRQVKFMYDRITNVVDYVIGNTVTQGVSSSIMNVRTQVNTASATGGATVQLNVIIDLSL